MVDIDFSKYPLPARTRHHTNPSYYIPLKELAVVPTGYPPLVENVDWGRHFTNGLPPKILDIGCGRGLFLLKLADMNQSQNVLGIEVRLWCCQWLENYIANEKIDNCSVLRYCVANELAFLGDASIDEIYYLFPDPWVKNRHKKRRAFNNVFLDEIFRLLSNNASLFLATDLLEVHKYHIKTLEQYGKFVFDEIASDANWNKPRTNKELFCIKENIPYYRIVAHKKCYETTLPL